MKNYDSMAEEIQRHIENNSITEKDFSALVNLGVDAEAFDRWRELYSPSITHTDE